MGDGQRTESGLVLCTDSYTIKEVVFLVNVLIIRYNLICTIRENKIGKYRIYIRQKYPPKTEKLKRLNLIPEFYELKDLKAHKYLPDTPLGKTWESFMNKWLN